MNPSRGGTSRAGPSRGGRRRDPESRGLAERSPAVDRDRHGYGDLARGSGNAGGKGGTGSSFPAARGEQRSALRDGPAMGSGGVPGGGPHRGGISRPGTRRFPSGAARQSSAPTRRTDRARATASGCGLGEKGASPSRRPRVPVGRSSDSARRSPAAPDPDGRISPSVPTRGSIAQGTTGPRFPGHERCAASVVLRMDGITRGSPRVPGGVARSLRTAPIASTLIPPGGPTSVLPRARRARQIPGPTHSPASFRLARSGGTMRARSVPRTGVRRPAYFESFSFATRFWTSSDSSSR